MLKKLWKLLMTGGVLVALTGCASTPDISGWAQNSADLAGAVAAESKQVVDRLDQNYAQYEIGLKEGWFKQKKLDKWKKHRDKFIINKADIDATLTVMTGYADAIATLAATGETGATAAKSITNSVNNIVATVSKTFPISATAKIAFETFASAFTLMQTQDALAKVMTAVDGDVDNLAKVVTDSVTAQKKIISAVRLQEYVMINDRAGNKRMRWYVNNKGFKMIEDEFRDNANPVQAHAITALVAHLETRYRAKEEAQAASKQWKRKRIAALNQIVKATKVWRQAHLSAATVLRKCGGLRSLRYSCGNYTAANLKLAADRIRTIVAVEGLNVKDDQAAVSNQ